MRFIPTIPVCHAAYGTELPKLPGASVMIRRFVDTPMHRICAILYKRDPRIQEPEHRRPEECRHAL